MLLPLCYIACDVCTEAGVQLCKFHRIQAFNRHLAQHANKDELLSKYVEIPYQALTLVSLLTTFTVYYSLYMPAALNSCESKKSAVDDTKQLIVQWHRRLHACVTADEETSNICCDIMISIIVVFLLLDIH